MNLIKYLTAGRSLNRSKESVGKYKLVQGTFLPQFGPSKQYLKPEKPVARESKPEAAWQLHFGSVGAKEVSTRMGSEVRDEVGRSNIGAKEAAVTDREGLIAPQVAKQPAINALPEAVKNVKSAAMTASPDERRESVRAAHWTEKWRVGWLAPQQPIDEQVIVKKHEVAPPAREMTHLGDVVVVRNDLSETDLEAVPSGAGQKQESWSSAVGRLFHTTAGT